MRTRSAPERRGAAPEADVLRRRLLQWYDGARRRLPWRLRPSLYGTWIAEMMLQQTSVAAAAPYWERFLARFPDLRSLAAADESAVLAAWSGLGYYRRARALHAAARLLAAGGGRLPDSAASWRSLPGVGLYAAGAIASIALGERVAAVDANARRVLLRWLCATPRQAAAIAPARLQAIARELVDPSRPGDWNQAVMELGALVCLPATPRCGSCPVAEHCRAGRGGRPAAVREARPRRVSVPATLSLLVVRRRGAVLLAPPGAAPATRLPGRGRPLRADLSALHRGLWGLPGTPWYPTGCARQTSPAGHLQAIAGAWSRWLGADGHGTPRSVEACGRFSHAITSYRLEVLVARAELTHTAGVPLPGARWWPENLDGVPLSAMARKALRLAAAAVS